MTTTKFPLLTQLKDFDWKLLISALAICCISVVEIYSAQPTFNFWLKQLVSTGIGIIVFVIASQLNFQRLFDFAPYIYGGGILLLVAVLIVGVRINGQRCWINLGPLGTLQPSEFAKLCTVLMLARILNSVQRGLLTIKHVLVASSIVLLPVGLIMLEPDTGTALTFFPVLFVMLFLSGLSSRLIIVSIILALVSFPLGYKYVIEPSLKKYQRERITVIFNAIFYPEKLQGKEVREGYGYQTVQSMIAVGAGGPTGKGLSKGTQNRGGFIPAKHTDFIGSVVAEELGFVGCVLMLLAYLFISIHSINTAEKARERFGMLIIAGFITLFVFHILVNIGMVIGLVPIMGIPLPLMSYGGSSLLIMFIFLGLAANVYQRRYVN